MHGYSVCDPPLAHQMKTIFGSICYFSIFEIISDDNCYGQIAFKIHVVLLHRETPTMCGLAPITVELSKLKELLHASIIIVNTILSEKKRIGAEWFKKTTGTTESRLNQLPMNQKKHQLMKIYHINFAVSRFVPLLLNQVLLL